MKALSNKKPLVWLFGFISVVALVGAIAASTSLFYYNRILPNTVIAGVEVSSQSPSDALALLREKATELANSPIVVKLNKQKATTKLTDLGIQLVPEQSNGLITASDDSFLWLKPNYWRSFFGKKVAPLPYVLSQETLNQALEDKLGFSNTAKDAEIRINADGQLVVQPSSNGIKIDVASVEEQLLNNLRSGSMEPITAKHTETAAEISTSDAEVIKKEIASKLKVVTMEHEGRLFYLTVTEQNTLIDYATRGQKLTWSVNKNRLSALLNSKVSYRVNIAMIQKVIMTDTGKVTNEGKEGLAVDLAKLTNDVYQTITEQNTATVVIPTRVVAITENRITPGYVANLFPGLYVDINLKKQRMYIMQGAKMKYEFLISSGKQGTPTPTGLLYIKNKIEIAESRLYPGIWMRKWNALAKNADGSGYEGYGIHDLPCFDKNCNIVEGASHLGYPVSHGCIRLGHNNAVWFYENIPVGTPVNIHY